MQPAGRLLRHKNAVFQRANQISVSGAGKHPLFLSVQQKRIKIGTFRILGQPDLLRQLPIQQIFRPEQGKALLRQIQGQKVGVTGGMINDLGVAVVVRLPPSVLYARHWVNDCPSDSLDVPPAAV